MTRFGDWYVHDERSIKLVRSSLLCTHEDMRTPSHVAAFVEKHHALLGALDVVNLLVAANELVWQAFDFAGIGDWQRGAKPEVARAAV